LISKSTKRRVEHSIKLAADNLTVLRKADVYRVLEDADRHGLLSQAAELILQDRSDLKTEVENCINELA
jgi:hypothetical protein